MPSGQPAKCGTEGGYSRHRRTTKTEPCRACVIAHREYVRDQAARTARRRGEYTLHGYDPRDGLTGGAWVWNPRKAIREWVDAAVTDDEQVAA